MDDEIKRKLEEMDVEQFVKGLNEHQLAYVAVLAISRLSGLLQSEKRGVRSDWT